jgi:flagellar protein FliS
MLKKEIPLKGKAISHAIRIIDEGLKASLDKNAGGDLAQDLSALYGYMCQRLLIANLKNDPAALDEVTELLSGLKEAWEQIRPELAKSAAKPAPQAPRQERASSLTYGRV